MDQVRSTNTGTGFYHEVYSAIETLYGNRQNQITALRQEAAALVIEAGEVYLGQEGGEIAQAIYEIVPWAMYTVPQDENTPPPMNALPPFETGLGRSACLRALQISVDVLGVTLVGEHAGEELIASPELTPEGAALSMAATSVTSGNKPKDDQHILFDVVRDIYNDFKMRYGQGHAARRQELSEIGEVYLGKQGPTQVDILYDILPDMQQHLELVRSGQFETAKPVLAPKGAAVEHFAKALEIASKALEATIIGLHNDTLVILFPDSSAHEALDQWYQDRYKDHN